MGKAMRTNVKRNLKCDFELLDVFCEVEEIIENMIECAIAASEFEGGEIESIETVADSQEAINANIGEDILSLGNLKSNQESLNIQQESSSRSLQDFTKDATNEIFNLTVIKPVVMRRQETETIESMEMEMILLERMLARKEMKIYMLKQRLKEQTQRLERTERKLLQQERINLMRTQQPVTFGRQNFKQLWRAKMREYMETVGRMMLGYITTGYKEGTREEIEMIEL